MKTLRTTIALTAFAACGAAFAFDFNQDPIGSVTRTDAASYISATIVPSGLRPTSISVPYNVGNDPLITATWVQNTGSHHKTFLLQFDRTEAQVDAIQNNGWHIEDVEGYFKGNQKFYAVLAYAASDQPNQSKWFHDLTAAQLQAEYTAWSGRIADLDVRKVLNTNYYTGVMRKNTGAYKMGWYWHTAANFDDIAPFLGAKNARVVDICEREDGLYAVAYWTDQATYRYVKARSYSEIIKTAAYYGYRIENINMTVRQNQNWYTGVIVNTKNALTTKIGNLLRSTCDGKVGAYLKQVDGDVLADLQENELFYPASTMKVLMHATAIWTTPTANLNTRLIPVWDNHTSNNHANETPTQTALPAVVNPMMINSSNQMANACLDFWGMEGTEQICRGNFGMSMKTQIRNKLGLGGPYELDSFNEATLTDLGAVYENVHKKFNPTKRSFFKTNMLNDINSSTFLAVAVQERDKLGMTGVQFNQWRASWEWMAKAGTIPFNNTSGYASIAGWLKLPYKGRAGVTTKAYTFGIFKDDCTVNTLSIWTAGGELIRDQINESLATFKD